MDSLNNVIVYEPTDFEKAMAKTISRIPFLSKRLKVILRRYFAMRFRRRLMTDLTRLLEKAYANKNHEDIKWNAVNPDWGEVDYSWEVII